jgi:glycosyltransferase involved in cell wall biosynthesis
MAQALVERGHEVTMLLPPWQNPGDAGRRWEEGGVRVENVELPPSVPGLFQGLTAGRLCRRTKALRPDVVHLFKPKAYSGLVHWLMAVLPPRYGGRLVVDSDDWEGPGGWNELAGYSPLQRRFFAWQERWGLTHADAVTVASRTLESLVWALGVPQEQVFYVPNGGRGGMEARVSGQPSGDTILLYTRFFEFPPERVIDVFLRIRERLPAARMLVVGKGLFGEEETFLRLARDAGLGVRNAAASASDDGAAGMGPTELWDGETDVAYTGWVPAERLDDLFAQAKVAIYPFDDTLVNRAKCAVKLIDLLAAGVPVVAEDVGQNGEYVRDGETGLLVPPGDPGAFARAVTGLLREDALRNRIGRRAIRDIDDRFGWDHLVGTVEQAYGMGG